MCYLVTLLKLILLSGSVHSEQGLTTAASATPPVTRSTTSWTSWSPLTTPSLSTTTALPPPISTNTTPSVTRPVTTSTSQASLTTPSSGSTSALPPRGNTTYAAAGLESDDGNRIGPIVEITVGAVVLIAVAVIVVVLIVRKRMSKAENSEYITPGAAVSPNTPNTYSSLTFCDTNATYEEVMDPAYIPMGNAPADASQSKPAAAEDIYKIEDHPVVYQNTGFSDYQNA